MWRECYTFPQSQKRTSKEGEVIQNNHLLEKRSFNITKELAYIIKTFEDFRLIALTPCTISF